MMMRAVDGTADENAYSSLDQQATQFILHRRLLRDRQCVHHTILHRTWCCMQKCHDFWSWNFVGASTGKVMYFFEYGVDMNIFGKPIFKYN